MTSPVRWPDAETPTGITGEDRQDGPREVNPDGTSHPAASISRPTTFTARAELPSARLVYARPPNPSKHRPHAPRCGTSISGVDGLPAHTHLGSRRARASPRMDTKNGRKRSIGEIRQTASSRSAAPNDRPKNAGCTQVEPASPRPPVTVGLTPRNDRRMVKS